MASTPPTSRTTSASSSPACPPPTGPGISYTYDTLDRLKTATRGGAVTAIKYDQAGRKIGMDDPDMGTAGTTGDDTWAWSYSYDALGNLMRQKNARGQRLCLYYDALNRLTGKRYRNDDNCPSNPALNIQYTYDSTAGGNKGMGLRTGMSDPSGSTSWVYDTRGRVSSETRTIAGSGYTSGWTYNSADLPGTMTYPDGETVTYTYTDQMLPDTMTSSLAQYVKDTTYDEVGRIKDRTLGSDAIQAYRYYAWDQTALVDSQLVGQGGRLMSITAGGLQNLNYVYDAVGNVKSITDNIAAQTQTFGYDPLDRLTSASATGNSNSGGYSETDTYSLTTGNPSTSSGHAWRRKPGRLIPTLTAPTNMR